MFKLIKFYFKWLAVIMPGLSALLATRIFYTPQKSRQSADEIIAQNNGHEKFIETSQGKLKTIFWAKDDKKKEVILLAHGWGGRGTQLYRFIEPLLQHYNIITFDGPAHGESPGKITTLPKYALALAEIYKEFNASYIIAHSFGAGAAAIALARHGIKAKRLVLISPPFSVENVVNNFCKYLNISKKIAERIHNKMETANWHGVPRLQLAFSTLGPKINIPVLVFHSKDDRYINYSDGKLVAEYLPNADFITLDGLGHYRPICNDRVIEMVSNFISK